MSIVVVDDSITNLVVLKRLSASVTGEEIKGFTSAVEALRYLEVSSASAVIVDYQMPDIDGISFVRTLRQFERHMATPVLMVTGSGDDEIRDAARNAGVTGFLAKPVSVNQFKALLGQYLGKLL